MSTETVARAETPAATQPDGTGLRRDTRAALGMLAPFGILYLAFVVGPTLYGLVMSFTDASLVKGGFNGWAGFGNYAEALGSADFWSSLWHTTYFTLLTTPPLVVLALVFALLANRMSRGQWFYRLAFFMPYMLPSAVMALIFIWIYTPGLGLLDSWLSALGITPPNWLGSPNWAMVSLAMATVWWTLGFNFVLYLAGLQDISRDLYEAAAIDGASPWRQMRSITVPLLARTTTLVVVLQVIASLKVFDQMFIMTQGGPNFSTRPVLEYVYDSGFTDFRVGYASAVSMLFFLVIVLVSAVWLFIVRTQEKE